MYDSCYCNSSALGLGQNAYVILKFTSADQAVTKLYWIGGMLMASGTSLIFIIAINLLRKEPELRARSLRQGPGRVEYFAMNNFSLDD